MVIVPVVVDILAELYDATKYIHQRNESRDRCKLCSDLSDRFPKGENNVLRRSSRQHGGEYFEKSMEDGIYDARCTADRTAIRVVINSNQQHLSMFPPSGPQLPSFKSFLITGPYHPSAPIHLALSLDQKAILLLPSRDAFLEDLQQFNDSWLNSHSGKGRLTNLTSKVSIL